MTEHKKSGFKRRLLKRTTHVSCAFASLPRGVLLTEKRGVPPCYVRHPNLGKYLHCKARSESYCLEDAPENFAVNWCGVNGRCLLSPWLPVSFGLCIPTGIVPLSSTSV